MKLIKVETKGFKSFADLVTLTFDGGVVGVVGPNGSGKSNINDAIKWVLGEMSAKSLRGDSMDDVIFAGSKTEPALDKAEVSLTFDNSDGENSIPHKVFTISRVLKRGGQSEYFINGETARLKDIKDIALESGISKSSLAIISQGTVQDIAQATSEQRRVIFEEAAGVSKYKARKEEALRKLEKTTESLASIDLVASELEHKLKPLKRQAEKAQLFLEKQEALKSVEISFIVDDVSYYADVLETLTAELSSVIEAKDDANGRIRVAEIEMETKSKQKQLLDNEIHKLENEHEEIVEKLEQASIRANNAAQKRKAILENGSSDNSDERIQALQEEIQDCAIKLEKSKQLYDELNNDISERKQTIQSLNDQLFKQNHLIVSNQNTLIKIKTKHGMLVEQKESNSHLHHGVKILLQNKKHFSGLHDIVQNLIKVDERYSSAIETAIQGSLQNLVVDKSNDAVKMIDFLKENRAGRASFIPLDTINPKSIREDHYQILQGKQGFIASGDQLVTVDAKFEIMKRYLLGNYIVVDTIQNANAISKIFKSVYPIVTMDGDIIRPGGIMTGGAKNRSSSFSNVDVEIQSLESQIPSIESNLITLKGEISIIEGKIEQERSIIAEKSVELLNNKQKIISIEGDFSSMRSEYEVLAKKKVEITNILSTTAKADAEVVIELENQKNSIRTLLKAKRDSSINITNDLARILEDKSNIERVLRDIQEQSATKMTEKNKAEYIVKSSTERLLEEYQMTFEAAKETASSLTMDKEEAREIIINLKSEIRALGSVNLDAIEEYERENARFLKIDANRQEIRNAYDTIIDAISKMDQVIITKMDETIKLVDKEMKEIFKVMFGGGMSHIKYTDPSDLLTSGIDVIAQPPGKTVKNLKLFSGGEKALVAISLLFAILKAKPLPLCILDEVEAALDDANVIRFANYLQELKKLTQFIVVTHRVGTMARVDHLFGATMQKRGVTSFFSVELAKAKELLGEKND